MNPTLLPLASAPLPVTCTFEIDSALYGIGTCYTDSGQSILFR